MKDKKLTSSERDAAIRTLYSDPSTCPLGLCHPPNGIEFGIGCAMCRDQRAEAENVRKSGEQERNERIRLNKLRIRMEKLIPNEHTVTTNRPSHASDDLEQGVWLLPPELIHTLLMPKASTRVSAPTPLKPSVLTDISNIDRVPPPSSLQSPIGMKRSSSILDFDPITDTFNAKLSSPPPSLNQLTRILSQPRDQEVAVDSNKENILVHATIRSDCAGAILPTVPPLNVSQSTFHSRRSKLIHRTNSVDDIHHKSTFIVKPPPMRAPQSNPSAQVGLQFAPPFEHLPVNSAQPTGLISYLGTDNLAHPYINPCDPTLHTTSDSSPQPTPFLCDFSYSSLEGGQTGGWKVFNEDHHLRTSSIQTRAMPFAYVQMQFHHISIQLTHYAIYVPSSKATRTMEESRKAAAVRLSGKLPLKERQTDSSIDPNMYIKSWRLEGSNTGRFWEVLDQQQGSDALKPIDGTNETLLPTSTSALSSSSLSSSSIFSWSRSRSSRTNESIQSEPHRRIIFTIPNSWLSHSHSRSSSSSSAAASSSSSPSPHRYTMFRLVQTELNSLDTHVMPFHGFEFFGRILPACADERYLLQYENDRSTNLIRSIRLRGGAFTLPCDEISITPGLEVPLTEGGLVVHNLGSAKWRAIRVEYPLKPSSRQMKFEFSFRILNDPPTTNSWHFNIGIVNHEFDLRSRCWIGAQKNSYGYIAGTGGICNESGLSTDCQSNRE